MRVYLRLLLLAFFMAIPGIALGSVCLNEYLTGNLTGILDEDGDHEDWIEIYNNDPVSVNLAGYGLSDELSDPFKWTFPAVVIPAGQRLLIFASGKDRSGSELHANFKLSSEGEALLLSKPIDGLVDYIDTGALPGDISRGRLPDGGVAWFFFAPPTPAAPNTEPGFIGIAHPPAFSVPPGHQVGPFALGISSPSPGARITYTLDGSDPDENSASYLNPLSIAGTSVLRARCFETNYLPSAIATASYFFGEGSTLPLISLVSDPANLFDEETGIYAFGADYEPDFPYFGANFWEDWERPAHIEFFEPTGELGFAIDLGIKIHGGWTRGYPQKSLRLCARGGYGASEIEYPVFGASEPDEFEFLILRNSGNDWCQTHFRDALMQSLTAGFDLDGQAYRPARVFINGEYWGIHNIRERLDEHYIASHHDVDEDEIDLLELLYWELAGDNSHYLAMLDFIETHDMADDLNYSHVQTLMDTDNFATYNIFEIFFGNTDWPGNNVKYWRPRSPGGRWRWLLYDLDFGLGLGSHYSHDILEFALEPDGPAWPNPPWATYLLRKLMENATFRRDFINRYADLLNTRLLPDLTQAAAESFRARIEPEMTRHMSRWDSDYDHWQEQVDHALSFLSSRPYYAKNHVRLQFSLPGFWDLNLAVYPRGAGTLRLTGIEVDSTFSGSYFQGNPVPVTALPASGFVFAGWSDPRLPDTSSVLLDGGPDAYSLTAQFAGAVINEINYNSADDFDPGDWVELHNPTLRSIDLGGWQFKDENDAHVFTLPPGTVLAAGDYLLLCADSAAFMVLFPDAPAPLGDLGFGFSGGGEVLRLFDTAGTLIDSVAYDDHWPWPEEPDGDGPTLELIDPLSDNDIPASWSASAKHGTPGARNSVHTGLPTGDDGPAPALALAPAWPNPFNPVTHLAFTLPEAGPVRLSVYDVRGRRVAVIQDGHLSAGRHEIPWHAESQGSGVYFIRLQAQSGERFRKVLLLK